MTTLIMCVIKDRVADTYHPPFCVPNTGIAVRMFTDEINKASEQNIMYKHPDDFDLYQLGMYDDETALVTQDAVPRQLCLGRDVKNSRGNGNAS